MQILILGMHRSGTSLTTRLVNMMGAYLGPEIAVDGKNADNPKGFWEHPEVFLLNDAILGSRGCSWHDLRQWQFQDAHKIPEKLARHIERFVGLMNAKRPWVLKDPRHCLLLPAWRPYLDAPLAVIVHRDPIEIALSLEKRYHIPVPYSLALWEHYAVGMITATREMPRIFVQHRKLLKDPTRGCKDLYEQLVKQGVQGLHMPAENEIREFIDAALYRSKPGKDADYALTPHQQGLNEIIQGLCPAPDHVSVSETSRSIMQKGPG